MKGAWLYVPAVRRFARPKRLSYGRGLNARPWGGGTLLYPDPYLKPIGLFFLSGGGGGWGSQIIRGEGLSLGAPKHFRLRWALVLRDVFINVFLQIYQSKCAHQVFFKGFSIIFEKTFF